MTDTDQPTTGPALADELTDPWGNNSTELPRGALPDWCYSLLQKAAAALRAPAQVEGDDLRVVAQRILDRGYVSSSIEEERGDYEALKKALTRPTAAPDDEAVRESIAAAYVAGATDTHNWWAAGNVESEADFTEAADDYARAYLARKGDA